MSDRHITPELVVSVMEGRISPAELMRILQEHVRDLCPWCREGLAVLARLSAGDLFLRATPPEEELVRREDEVARALALAKASEEARPVLEILRQLPPEDCRAAVAAGSLVPVAGPVLAHLLLEESLACLPAAPAEGLGLARLARVALAKERPTVEVKRLYARAMACVGNALRVQGQLREAAEAINDARFWLSEEAGGPPLLRAELDRFEGSLRRAERRFPEAVRLLRRAMAVYVEHERPREAVLTAIKLAMTHREAGEFSEALFVARKALQAVVPEEEPTLAIYARHNLALALNDAGQPKPARRLLERNRRLYESYPDPLSQLRHQWLEGKIARNLAEPVHAEHCLRRARDGFLAEGIGYDAALVSLDLAVFYLEQGKTGAVKQLAEEIAPVFLAQDVHREASAALSLFQEAARREAITAAFVRDLALYLEAARKNPEMAFREAR